MESARPRAEARLCGPRAGQLHFAIYPMYHRSATIRLSFLQRDISIGTFDPVKIMPRNGMMLNKTQCGLGWSRQLSHGRIAGR